MFHARESDGVNGPVTFAPQSDTRIKGEMAHRVLDPRTRPELLIHQPKSKVRGNASFNDDDTNSVEMLRAPWALNRSQLINTGRSSCQASANLPSPGRRDDLPQPNCSGKPISF